MNRVRALLICTRPKPTHVREAAKHPLAQANITEEVKQLASKALEGLHDTGRVADAHPGGVGERSHSAAGNVQREDVRMTGLLGEVRALHEEIYHIGHRVRRLDEKAAP